VALSSLDTRCLPDALPISALRPALKGMRWALLKDVFSLGAKAGAALHGLIRAPRLTRTARAWTYKERLREILGRKQINVMRGALDRKSTRLNSSHVKTSYA